VAAAVGLRRVLPPGRGRTWAPILIGTYGASLAGFLGIASGSHGPTTLAFVAAVLVLWSWLTTVCVHFSNHE
jgi:hypothetical protein